MKEFKTISEYEVLRMARQALDGKAIKAEERGDMDKVREIEKQTAEITARMEEIAREENAR